MRWPDFPARRASKHGKEKKGEKGVSRASNSDQVTLLSLTLSLNLSLSLVFGAVRTFGLPLSPLL
eukprot:CAMPEP_0198451470 /NCGR_PEP_ID=MMETSP1453-20131121/5811_1 /TAXON_ID=1461543 ORGANISM="Unidentified sp., Strain RCC701" /NCGR_SAMPLE_ID=MMETSP1453 /ASSEMBLY_ACC=CAM_ASM_001118 /LENGTH=64 /DNA_ID=CAMNT_0044174705 /DNA_START=1 /DNA_END=191 /DNA_ORIENTATION=-